MSTSSSTDRHARHDVRRGATRDAQVARIAGLALLLVNALGCAHTSAYAPPVPSHPEALVVGVLVVDGVYNTELTAPIDIFHHTMFHDERGMRVFTVAPERRTITTFEGLRLQPDHDFDSCPPLDVLVVPSAQHSMDSDLEDERLLAWVAETGAAASWVVSLCDGAFVLAAAGLLDGHESTTFPGDIGAYRARFPQLTVHADVLFVHDGRMLTSAGGARSFDVALYLCERLYGPEAVAGIAEGMVLDWDLADVPHVIVERP